ncbi:MULTISPECIES: carboxylating nicotinate-nucleotide diphosphorylase [Brevibacterium]|uniref:nicotinate-nucleotide diphosphorylase (carboxylating) n=1 Tax=Brevibacterium salitolerans TaxID=1403566 RepID=A0ABN2WYD9_9MICO|nr:carboxylating nicotinate-nucleotide diphosphorylase [Brevibacterium sp.]
MAPGPAAADRAAPVPAAPVPAAAVRRIAQAALQEDAPRGDVTAATFVPAGMRTRAAVVAREAGVMAGGEVFAAVVREAAAHAGTGECRVQQTVSEAAPFSAGDVLLTVEGPAHTLLLAERTALNLLQRMCAVAALTWQYADAVSGCVSAATGRPVRIADTRKTTPGLRILERYAVRCGGGANHRDGLSDAVMLKDNHVTLLGEGEQLTAALRAGRARLGHTVHVEVEVDRLDQIEAVADAGIDTIMLDNFSPAELVEGIRLVDGRALVEASGGVSLQTVRAIAETGVDVISVGALTHSVRNLDLGLDTVDRDSHAACGA